MNVRVKRLMASWVLLAVYVPILVVASLHMHPSEMLAQNTCSECVHHNCGGHMGQQTVFVHACVLCQFLTLPMLPVALATIIIYNKVFKAQPQLCQRNICVARRSIVGLRAPPSV